MSSSKSCIVFWTLMLVGLCLGKTIENGNKVVADFKQQNPQTCCNLLISDLNFRLTNPSYPTQDSGSRRYSYNVEMQPETCGVRVQFQDMQLKAPGVMGASGCSTDSVTILARDFPSQPQCGRLNNFFVNVPTKVGDHVEILVVVQSTRYAWNMVISQIPCSSISSTPLSEYRQACGKRPRSNNILGDFGISGLFGVTPAPSSTGRDEDEQLNDYDPSEESHTIINDPDKYSCDERGDLFRCHVENVIEKEAAKTVLHNRIVNGQTARRNSWPWQVVLLVKGKYLLCGGALLSPSVAVTAGHCLATAQKGLSLDEVVVASGVHRIGTPTYGAQFRRCKAAAIHPGYLDVHDDISLCFFDEPVQVTERIKPVCLPYDKANTFSGEKGYITGWGKTLDHNGPASTLQEAAIPIVTNEACTQAWEETGGRMFQGLIEKSMICGGGNNRSTCNGDSGGPLSVYDSSTDKYTLVGLTSFGPSTLCNVPGKPLSVFTRITSQLDFIALSLAPVTVDLKELKTYTTCV